MDGGGEVPEQPLATEDQRDLSQDARKTMSSRLNKCCTKLMSKKCWKHKNMQLLIALTLGQLLSMLLCASGVISQILVTKHSVSVPTTQNFFAYILLGMVYGVVVTMRGDFITVLRRNWWKYIILGIVDVEANYFVVIAYKYTNLTTIQLLDSFGIVVVMVLSFIFLRARYKIINFMGVALSIVGIFSLVLADIQGERAGRGPKPLVGDLLCLVGALLYAISNVAQEFLVKNHSITEFLGFIGFTGSFVCGIQLLVLERRDLVLIDWNVDIGLLLLGFGMSQFLFYSIVPLLLKLSSALVFNMSLLTADVYTFIFGLVLFHYGFSFFYILSFILILTGVFIYNLRQPSTAKKKEKKEETRDGGSESQGKEEVSGLRQALFESQTYELSESKSKSHRSTSPNHSTTSRKPKGLISKLARKLMKQLPSAGPTPADHSAMRSSSKRNMRMLDDDSKEGLICEGGRGGSISSDGNYGSVERSTRLGPGSAASDVTTHTTSGSGATNGSSSGGRGNGATHTTSGSSQRSGTDPKGDTNRNKSKSRVSITPTRTPTPPP